MPEQLGPRSTTSISLRRDCVEYDCHGRQQETDRGRHKLGEERDSRQPDHPGGEADGEEDDQEDETDEDSDSELVDSLMLDAWLASLD